jgi:gliding motility associated protien GldN
MKKYFLILSLFSVSFAFAQDNLEEVEEKLDGAYEKVTLKEREIIPYDHVRESDVIWSKRIWRVIDCKEKVNLPFVHPKMGLVKVVHDAAKKGELQVYNPGEIGETFKETISTQEVQNIGVRNDTISRINIESGLEERVATFNDFDPSTVTKLRLKEDWFFDKETSTMLVRIIGVALIREKLSENGDVLGDEVMYWVYYPDLRTVLSQHQVYNIKNDAATMSWEDLFEIRYFSSYIMKESNAYDRRIKEYAAGLDLLYESDRIQNDIRNYESDLWEY